MKLAKALRVKNKLVKEISELEGLISENNSYVDVNPPKWDVKKLMSELYDKKNKLIELKTKISTANVKIAKEIHQMEEIKGDITFLKGISTKDGKFPLLSYSDTVLREEKYIATYDTLWIDKFVKEKQKQVDTIQDKLNEFNYSTEINFS